MSVWQYCQETYLESQSKDYGGAFFQKYSTAIYFFKKSSKTNVWVGSKYISGVCKE